MKYILDDEGYVFQVALGCSISCDEYGECVEYTGAIPEGYESLDEWIEYAPITAYKIVDGNLVLDVVRLAEIESEEALTAEENRTVTAKELYNVLSISSEVNNEEFAETITGDNLLHLTNSGNYAIPKFKLTRAESPNTWGYLSSFTWEELSNYTWEELKKIHISSWNDDVGTWNEDTTTWGTLEADIPDQCFPRTVEIVTSNKNLLPSLIECQTINGLEVTPNGDGSLTINGTATADTEITLCGTDQSTEMLFMLKRGTDYTQSGLEMLALKLYEYDGIDRKLVSELGNGALTVTELTRITHATLSITSGTILSNVKVFPQIEVGASATDFVVNKRDYFKITLSNDSISAITYDNGRIDLNGETSIYTSNTIKTFDTETWLMISVPCNAEVTYYLQNVIEQMKTMKIKADRIDLEGYTTIINTDEFARTKVEFLPDDDLEAVVKISVQHLIDGEDAPFVPKFIIDKTGEVHLTGTLYIDSGAMDAIEITDASGVGYINSTGFHTS